jgi:hypothetical protein
MEGLIKSRRTQYRLCLGRDSKQTLLEGSLERYSSPACNMAVHCYWLPLNLCKYTELMSHTSLVVYRLKSMIMVINHLAYQSNEQTTQIEHENWYEWRGVINSTDKVSDSYSGNTAFGRAPVTETNVHDIPQFIPIIIKNLSWDILMSLYHIDINNLFSNGLMGTDESLHNTYSENHRWTLSG